MLPEISREGDELQNFGKETEFVGKCHMSDMQNSLNPFQIQTPHFHIFGDVSNTFHFSPTLIK